jgi:hypothetical protein
MGCPAASPWLFGCVAKAPLLEILGSRRLYVGHLCGPEERVGESVRLRFYMR